MKNEIKDYTILGKNNNEVSLVVIVNGRRDTPERNVILFTAWFPKYKMLFNVGWELKDAIPRAIPSDHQEYRYLVIKDYEHINNSNEDYWCIFVDKQDYGVW